jgi:Icc-related predicted phosphoesterase
MKTIEFIFDNVLLKGLILKRERYYIEVQLISPFEAWKNYGMISGMCRMTPKHLLTEYGEEVIRQLLIASYQKSKMLHDSFDRISKVHLGYKSELISLNEISDIQMRSTIQNKLEDWFFDTIFTSSITGVIASNNDRKHVFEILENHLKQKENKEKSNEYGIWLEKLIEYLNKRGLKL